MNKVQRENDQSEQRGNGSGQLPHWDMSVVYPGLDSAEFTAGAQSVVQAIDELQRLFDENQIGTEKASWKGQAPVELFEQVLQCINETMEQASELNAYITSFVATDSRNTLAQARLSEMQLQAVRVNQLGTRLTAWLGSLDVETLLEQSELAQAHAYALHKAKIQSTHLMSPAEEALTAELNMTGGSAWSKLYNNFTSQLLVPLDLGDGTQELPMSSVRNLAYHSDRSLRETAYQAELTAWEKAGLPLAAALNSIKGEVNNLAQRRNWDSVLETTLFQNNIEGETLAAMLAAARDAFPDFRRYLNAKARALGLEKLAWYDIFAPVGQGGRIWSYEEATDFISEQFGTFSPKMQALAERAFREKWIDAEPRAGKRDGAFCMKLRQDESRILANFKDNFNAVSTLAHELGHAYHNLNLAQRTVTQKVTPMTLAETASIFCETIVKKAALAKTEPEEQLVILETSLQGMCQVVVDISSRFLFEQAVFAKRQQRELSVPELNSLMLDAQKQTYGEGLDENLLHPYMWAAKGHYYSSSRSYYNYPYMFGLLFGLGLYARYQETPSTFREEYDDLLSRTGMGDADELSARFGIDIRTPDFWRSSLDVIRADIDRFIELV